MKSALVSVAIEKTILCIITVEFSRRNFKKINCYTGIKNVRRYIVTVRRFCNLLPPTRRQEETFWLLVMKVKYYTVTWFLWIKWYFNPNIYTIHDKGIFLILIHLNYAEERHHEFHGPPKFVVDDLALPTNISGNFWPVISGATENGAKIVGKYGLETTRLWDQIKIIEHDKEWGRCCRYFANRMSTAGEEDN